MMFIKQAEGDLETPGCTWGFHWMPGLVLGFEGGLTNSNWDLMRNKWRFWLGNVLRATTACKFSSLIWPAGSAPSRFSEPSFRPSGATNHWKNTVFRDFPTFSRTCIFFLLTLSLLWSSLFCSSLFYSSLLSDSSHLCFSSVHIVGSLTSKLPSII